MTPASCLLSNQSVLDFGMCCFASTPQPLPALLPVICGFSCICLYLLCLIICLHIFLLLYLFIFVDGWSKALLA